MKAILMAGGEGTRLRPLTLNIPKPMVKLLDKPVIEHSIDLLKKHGIKDIGITLAYRPMVIMDHLGNGSEQGVHLEYFVEDAPLGTAGSVKQGEQFIGSESFIVLSGDAVCDLNLSDAIAFHNREQNAVTVVTYHHDSPLEYGIVLTDKEQNITQFVEKPSWNQVFSDSINTGIYILSPSVLAKIPVGIKFDFAKDLFPILLAERQKMKTFQCEGYWRDMGDCKEYLQSSIDALGKKVQLETGRYAETGKVLHKLPLQKNISYTGAIFIDKDVEIEEGAKIGENTILLSGAYIESGATVQGSVIAGRVSRGANVQGAILCPGSIVGRHTQAREGAVIGPNARVGDHVIIGDSVRVWADKVIADHTRIASDVKSNIGAEAHFDGSIMLASETLITPEYCLRLGLAIGNVIKNPRVGLASSKEAYPMALASSLASGVSASGGAVLQHDSHFPSLTAFISDILDLNISVHIEQSGVLAKLTLFDQYGLPIDRYLAKQLENEILRGELNRVSPLKSGPADKTSGLLHAYIAEAARGVHCNGIFVAVTSAGEMGFILKEALRRCGCKLRTARLGIPAFELSVDGLQLMLADENGIRYTYPQSLCITAMCAIEEGAKELAASYNAPAALDDLAAEYGIKLLRVGRDGVKAKELYYRQRYMRDGIFAAAKVTEYMAKNNLSLSKIAAMAPKFAILSKEISLKNNKAKVMHSVCDSFEGNSRELFEGMKTCVDGAWVHITPSVIKESLRISVEGASEEIAEELCAEYAKRIAGFDRDLG